MSRTETATHTWHFCISPWIPYAVRGVVWLPTRDNINDDVSGYPTSLRADANRLAETYGQDRITRLDAPRTAELSKR